MTDNPKIKCISCGPEKIPKNILVMRCNHNLCLEHASMVFRIGKGKEVTLKEVENRPFQLKCGKCHEKTALDKASLTKLLLLARSIPLNDENHSANDNRSKGIKMRADSSKPPLKVIPIHENFSNKPIVKPLIPIPIVIEDPNINKFCKLHPQKEAEYLCLDCKIPPICATCAMDVHKSHECDTLSTNMKKLRDRISKANVDLTQSSNKEKDMLNTIQTKLKGCKDQTMIFKAQTKAFFDGIKQSLVEKEQELCEQADNNFKDATKILEHSESQIVEHINAVERDVSLINGHVNCKNENSLVNFYIKYYGKISETCAKITGGDRNKIPDPKYLFNDELGNELKAQVNQLKEHIKTIQVKAQVKLENISSNENAKNQAISQTK